MSAAGGFEGQAPPGGEPTEEEMRAAYEAELSRITTTDLIAQATISILNLGARKLGPPGEGAPGEGAPGEGPPEGAGGQDLEQVRDAIDAVRGMLEILERRIPEELPPLRDALSRLQMAYAQEIQRPAAAASAPTGAAGSASASGGDEDSGEDRGGGTGGGGEGGGAPGGEPGGPRPEGSEQRRPGPAESSGRLWVPGK